MTLSYLSYIFIFIITVCHLSEPFNSSNSINYTAFIINQRERIHPGLFQCVFMNMANPSEATAFDQLLQSSMLSHINKYVIDKQFTVTYEKLPHKPSLIVIYSDGPLRSSEVKLFRSNLHVLDCNAHVLVLVNTTEPNQMEPINAVLTKWRFNYVVYLNTDETLSKVTYVDTTGSTIAQLDSYPHPVDLFRNAIRDMQGRPMIYAFDRAMELHYENWLIVTAWYLNATPVQISGPCLRDMPGLDCLVELYVSCDMDISLNQFVLVRILPDMYRMLFNIQPDAEVIIAPRGRRLNIVEIFIKPFRWEAWSALVLTLVIIEIISYAFPSLFKNDPILLLVCGFERQDLHHANTRERMIFLPLVMFFFLMTNVYETKITSYMMHPPSIADIHTIPELVKSGIKVKVNTNNNRKIVKDEMLGSLVINTTKSILQLDGVHAYVADLTIAEYIVRLMHNYDFELERPMYNILTERRRMDLYMFWVPFCTPLLETFYFTQKMVYEAGLWNKWMRQAWESLDAELRGMRRNLETTQTQQFLTYEDLVPAWIAISAGFLASGVLFLMELALGRVCAVGRG
uniref:ionotropic receptor 140 precursor n=1 Tax=Aedes aegypti TaxID=7159 RepID=UPI000C284B94|nr:ionotropic receptor 140 precursor [Aedes aegypti]